MGSACPFWSKHISENSYVVFDRNLFPLQPSPHHWTGEFCPQATPIFLPNPSSPTPTEDLNFAIWPHPNWPVISGHTSAEKLPSNYRASREKSTQPTANKRSSMKTIIFCFETPIDSKITDSLFNRTAVTTNLTRSLRRKKNLDRLPATLPGNCLILDPPPFWISVTLRGGGGMDIFWNYTFAIRSG